jgi:hypothetical protein
MDPEHTRTKSKQRAKNPQSIDDVASELQEQAAALVGEGRRIVEEFATERPHAAIAIAAGIGFVLGGGLTPRRLFRLGMLIGGPAITRELTDYVSELIGDRLDSPSERKAEPS